jgi:broad specificity phosphatase PhoE
MIHKKMKTASELIKIIGKQKDLLVEVDEAIRSFNAGDLEMNPDDFEDLVDDFQINNKRLTDAIKHILFSFKEQ